MVYVSGHLSVSKNSKNIKKQKSVGTDETEEMNGSGEDLIASSRTAESCSPWRREEQGVQQGGDPGGVMKVRRRV